MNKDELIKQYQEAVKGLPGLWKTGILNKLSDLLDNEIDEHFTITEDLERFLFTEEEPVKEEILKANIAAHKEFITSLREIKFKIAAMAD